MAVRSKSLEAAPFFVMRTPLLPFQEWMSWCGEGAREADRALLWARLRDVLARPMCRQAIFFAAPRVEAELARLDETGETPDDKLLRTLVRYFARMTGRTTPFGLFAGCSLGRHGTTSVLRIAGAQHYRCFTTLDVGHLLGMTELVRAAARSAEMLSVRANPSLYRVGDRLRFIEARTDPVTFARSYHLSAVEATKTIEFVLRLTNKPVSLASLAECVSAVGPGVNQDEAREFVLQLLQEQVLVDSLEPAVTGEEPLRDIISRLAVVEDDKVQHLQCDLSDLERQFRAVDQCGVGVPPARFREMLPRLSPAGAISDGDRVFQTDLVKPAPHAVLGADVLQSICDAALLLNRLTPPVKSQSLARFREAFQQRFEGCEVPLMEVLDPDVGVGFEVSDLPDEEVSPWLTGMPLAVQDSESVSWGRREAHLLQRLLETVDARAQVLELTQTDVDAVTVPEKPLPPFFSATAMIAALNAEQLQARESLIFLEHISGASGAELLGRFCQGDNEVAAAVKDWLRREEQFYQGALLAEIVHLPQGRAGNIICRPVLRSHEILCLAQSGAEIDRQIPLSDLTVRLEGQRVVLRSRKLGRDIVPRMTTAHDAQFADLMHYRFLCSLHLQDSAAVTWQWGPMAKAPFLPRVTHGNFVFARATWRLDPREFNRAEPRNENFCSRLARLREARRLPRHVLMIEWDRALPLDLDNVLCADVLAAEIRRGPVTLVEQFPTAEQLCATGPEGHFMHELIVPIQQIGSSQSTNAREPPRGKRVLGRPPAFPPGQSWLSAAIYGSEAMLDRLLISMIAPLVQNLRSTGVIDGWFFIRYWDPKAHLRVRFHGTPHQLRQEAWANLQEKIGTYLENGEIHVVRLDTYFPEVNRYGGPEAMASAEQFFEADSDMTLALLALDGHGLSDLRERAAVLASDALMKDFDLDEEAREALATEVGAALAAEKLFGPGANKSLGERFRALRGALTPLIVDHSDDADEWCISAREIIAWRSSAAITYRDLCRTLDQNGSLTAPVSDILISLIHMQVNRLMRGAPRAIELVIYDFLRRLYHSKRTQAANFRPRG